MLGQRPGECGRRIAGRDACPTQKGGLPPQQGVSALPLPGAPLYFFAHIAPTRTAGRCDKNLSCFCPSSLNPPSGLPLSWDLSKPDEAKQSAVRVRKRRREAGCSAQPPGGFFCIALDISKAKLFPPTAAHKGPDTAFQLFGGVRDATRPGAGAQKSSQGPTRGSWL